MFPTWLAPLKAAILNVRGLSRYWLVATKFVKRVSTIPGLIEKQQIDNMDAYLKSLSKHMSELKRRGVSDEELRFLAIQLSVPLLQSNLEAMVVARRLSGQRDDRGPSPNAPMTLPTGHDSKSPLAADGNAGASTDSNLPRDELEKPDLPAGPPRGKAGHDASAEVPGT